MLDPSSLTSEEVVVTHALRTPIGKFLGGLRSLTAVDLGRHVVAAVVERADLGGEDVDELIFGHGRQAGCGPNPARQVALGAGLPHAVPAMTVNMACASGLKALTLARESIVLGRSNIVVAGGMESMTNVPSLLPNMRLGYRLGDAEVQDAMYRDGFLCPLAKMIMGETAEKLASERNISRTEQDEYAAQTQQRCEAARKSGAFEDEIVPVEVHGRKGKVERVSADEHPRDGIVAAKLAKLPPVFDPEAGTVSAGNSSGITDGAAAFLLMKRTEAERRGLEVLATVGLSTQAGVDPTIMGIGPVPAVQELCRRLETTVEGFDTVELNEAFAAQVLACQQELHIPSDRLNPLGGAIALGHPIGASGARIIVTLLHEMRRRGHRNGLATLCVSGGMGVAASFHRSSAK